MPNDFHLQILIMILTALFFLAAFFVGFRQMHAATVTPSPARSQLDSSMGLPARLLLLLGILAALSLVVWRAFHSGRITLPLSNHMDSFLLLALLLAILIIYCRATRNLRALAFFLLPVSSALLLVGAILSFISPLDYSYHSIWSFVHIASIVVGTACTAGACAGAITFLIASTQLKRKGRAGAEGSRRWIGLPSLASIERFNRTFIFIGFPLLTIGIITGILRFAQHPLSITNNWSLASKTTLAFAAWFIYLLLVQLPFTPSFRGQRAAWLSILGFTLFLAAYVAANWMN